uniref:tumor suppressor 2, mitochondrial calcium regulator a isoform X1 n=2 Tax=Scatophagus argus TaxID=75038 RepID=UPI001ED81FAE|nr:tumor suppressor 2, mitochondrial calcium regulator a isoform X1 [Scatophagus argus]
MLALVSLCLYFSDPGFGEELRASGHLSLELKTNDALSLRMGGSGSKAKGVWPFSGSGAGGDSSSDGNEQSLARLKGSRNATPFVFTRRSSLYYDEDGDLAHEFYEETVVTKNGRKKSKLKRIQKNLIPQGIVKLDHPCIHVDFPIILCEV